MNDYVSKAEVLDIYAELYDVFDDNSAILKEINKVYDKINELKTQEPMVMTLEEVLALKFDDVVYVEVVPTHAVLSAIVLDVIPKLPKIGIGVVQFRYAPTWNGINNADLSYYDKTWRCWTSRPTDEQREKEHWNG